MDKEQVLDISWTTILKVFVAAFIFYFVYLTKGIALWFLFALAISVLLEPVINFFKKLWMPRIVAVLIVYFSIFGVLGFLIWLMTPLFISELKQLLEYLPDYLGQINPVFKQAGADMTKNIQDLAQPLMVWLAQSSKGVLAALMSFLGGLYSALFILTTAFLLSLEDRGLEKFLTLISPKTHEQTIAALFKTAQNKISGWFGARILACLFVGAASFVVFYIFGVEYALILALVSGILNFIPYIGPAITTVVLIVFVAASSGSWFTVLYVIIAVLVIQWVENQLLTPLLMKKLVDVPPVLVLISLFVGAELFGFLGMIFAIPVLGIIYEFIKEFLQKRREILETD